MSFFLESLKENAVNFFNLKRVFTHADFNPKSENFYYIRQSKTDDSMNSKLWQYNNLLETSNTIYSNNSAYKEQTSGYIFTIIKKIFYSGNNNFIISVADFSRFSRSEKCTLDIYHFLMSNLEKDYNFYLEVDDKIYNYREEYYKGLLNKFKFFESISKEQSRLAKKIHRQKKYVKNLKNYSKLATDYFKTYISYANPVFSSKLKNLGRVNFTDDMLKKYKKETKEKKNLLKLDKFLYYFYCKKTNLMIVCPREIATLENIDYSIIKGFTKEDFLAIFNSNDKDLEWIIYRYDAMDLSTINEIL